MNATCQQTRFSGGYDAQGRTLQQNHGICSLLPCWSFELVQDVAVWSPCPIRELCEDFVAEVNLLADHLAVSVQASCCGSWNALFEIAKDTVDIKDERQLLAPIVMVMTIGMSPSPPGIVLSGFAITTKASHIITAVGLAAGACKIYQRWPDHADRTIQVRSAVLLLVSAAYNAFVGIWGLPPILGEYVARPDSVARFITELVAQPLLIANLDYLGGRKQVQMSSAILAIAGYAACTGALAIHDLGKGLALLGLGTCTLATAWADITPGLLKTATLVSSTNRARAQVSVDLLLFTWMMYPLADLACLLGATSAELNIYILEFLDVLQKLGLSHILLKSEYALKRSCSYRRQET